MADKTQYYQCRMKRADITASVWTTGWIEARGAKVGAQVEIMPSRDVWEVVEIYENGLSIDALKEHQKFNRKSLPSIEPMA
jgi:hypothetical protein